MHTVRCILCSEQLSRLMVSGCAESKKTVEGTIGGAVVTIVAWVALIGVARWSDPKGTILPDASGWACLVASTAAASLLEASTTQLDNVFLPLHIFSLLCSML